MSRQKKPTGRARREAMRKARLRKQRNRRLAWGGVVSAMVLGLGALILMSQQSGTSEPEAAPDFELQRFDGEPVKLSDYRGRPVAVTFMHTW